MVTTLQVDLEQIINNKIKTQMIKIINEVDKETFLIHLEGTEYYQVWNKWELFELLLDNKTNLKEGWDNRTIKELSK